MGSPINSARRGPVALQTREWKPGTQQQVFAVNDSWTKQGV